MMRNSDWFEDLPVIAQLPDDELAKKLEELGDIETAALLQTENQNYYDDNEKSFSILDSIFGVPAWKHAAHTFGFIAPLSDSQKSISIKHVSEINAAAELKNSRITITLDGLRVADYPGRGDHRILFDFYGQNQAPTSTEDLHFNATFRVREGERAAVIGFPIFVGLNVGEQGVNFKCFTINVKNTNDEAFLSMLESDIFKQGLKLATVAQPAIAPLTGIAVALTRSIAKRNQNVPVQDFYLGLDFSNVPTRARLAIGSYIAVQIPESMSLAWDWSEWEYLPQLGHIVNRLNPEKLIPYNYIIFGVSHYSEPVRS
jgi:hypothetical protein